MSRADLKDKAFIRIAETLGVLSTCDRASIGAVLVRDGRCVSWGFNGAPPGLPHCDENLHGWGNKTHYNGRELGWRDDEGVWNPGPTASDLSTFGCLNSTHAEANALAFAARQGIPTEGCTLYVSQSPCDTCSRLLIAAGIVRVVWETEYRDPAGLNLLAEAGVELL